jgi:hypothetical protein
VEHGTCPLCLKDKPICFSHLIPEAMYKYTWQGDRPPMIYTSKEVGSTEEQLTAYLLCQECENRLNKDGENWLLPKLAHYGGPFPFYEIVTKRCRRDIVHDFATFYACGDNQDIAFRKLANFVIGVFWKASVHPWGADRKTPRIHLGPYQERFRLFLDHKATFPSNTNLQVVVAPPEKALVCFDIPSTRHEKPFHQYVFNIPGMTFLLAVGKGIQPEWKEMCFYTNKLHPVMVADLSGQIMKGVQRYSRNAARVDRASPVGPPRKKKS